MYMLVLLLQAMHACVASTHAIEESKLWHILRDTHATGSIPSPFTTTFSILICNLLTRDVDYFIPSIKYYVLMYGIKRVLGHADYYGRPLSPGANVPTTPVVCSATTTVLTTATARSAPARKHRQSARPRRRMEYFNYLDRLVDRLRQPRRPLRRPPTRPWRPHQLLRLPPARLRQLPLLSPSGP